MGQSQPLRDECSLARFHAGMSMTKDHVTSFGKRHERREAFVVISDYFVNISLDQLVPISHKRYNEPICTSFMNISNSSCVRTSKHTGDFALQVRHHFGFTVDPRPGDQCLHHPIWDRINNCFMRVPRPIYLKVKKYYQDEVTYIFDRINGVPMKVGLLVVNE